MKIQNVIIVLLVFVVVALLVALWLSLGSKPAPLPAASLVHPSALVAPISEPPALAPVSQTSTPTPTSAPVVPLSERDKRLAAAGFEPGSKYHKLSTHQVSASAKNQKQEEIER